VAKRVPTMLGVRATAERVRLPEHFVRSLVWERKVHFVKAGNRYLISLGSVCDYLNGNTENPVHQ